MAAPNLRPSASPDASDKTSAPEVFRRFHIGLLFQQLARDFERRARATLRARGHVGLQPSHQVVFASLVGSGARLTELAERAGMTKQAMGQLVDDLESLGYVERIPDPADGRAKIVRLTPDGRSFLDDAADVVSAIWDDYASLLGERELANLQSRLGSLLDRARAGAET
ncbi:MAG: MarR family winged helix-turn-helix transcriptional regulator [Myxococcota bacterium]